MSGPFTTLGVSSINTISPIPSSPSGLSASFLTLTFPLMSGVFPFLVPTTTNISQGGGITNINGLTVYACSLSIQNNMFMTVDWGTNPTYPTFILFITNISPNPVNVSIIQLHTVQNSMFSTPTVLKDTTPIPYYVAPFQTLTLQTTKDTTLS